MANPIILTITADDDITVTHTILLPSAMEWQKLCAETMLAHKVFSLARIVSKKGRGTLIKVDSLELTTQPVEWFYPMAEIYFNIVKKGPKLKALVFNILGRPHYFSNKLNFGKVCVVVASEGNPKLLEHNEKILSYCEPLDVDENGNLVTIDISDWTVQHYAAEWKRLSHCDIAISNFVEGAGEVEEEAAGDWPIDEA